MKKLMLVLLVVLAMVMLCFTVNSYALEFRGLRLGMTKNELRQWLDKQGVVATPESIADWSLMDRVQQKLIEPGCGCLITISGSIDDPGKLEKISCNISQDISNSYKDAIHRKYGNPGSSKQVPYQNNFGLKMMGLEEHWNIGKDHIWFLVAPESIGKFTTYLIFITDEWNKLESKKPEPKL
jgi:hypothetical protein